MNPRGIDRQYDFRIEQEPSTETEAEKALKDLNIFFGNSVKDEDLKLCVPGFLALEKEIGQPALSHGLKVSRLEHGGDREFVRFFKAFTPEGLEAARKIFGYERPTTTLTTDLKTELFEFSESELMDLIDALGDETPYDKTWELLQLGWPLKFVRNAHLIKERKGYFTQEEFDVLLQQSDVANILVNDGRRPDWCYFVDDTTGVVGLEVNLKDHPVISSERIEEWREVAGGSFIDLLRNDPPSDLFEKFAPSDLEGILQHIPDLFERLSKDAQALDEFTYFFQTAPKEVAENLDAFLEMLTPKQKRLFLERPIKDISRMLNWIDEPRGRLVWETLLDSCSPLYVDEVLQDPVWLPDHIWNSWQIIRNRHTVDSLQERFREEFALREEVDRALNQEYDIKTFMEEYPQAKPYLRLVYARQKEQKFSPEICMASARELKEKMDGAMKERFDPSLVPTVGVEIEIMEGTKMKRPLIDYTRTAVFGVSQRLDEQIEFSIDPATAPMQARMLREFINGDWIQEERMEDGQYSMHVNVGIPEGVPKLNDIAKSELAALCNALTIAYGNHTRIMGGEFGSFTDIHEADEEGEVDRLDSGLKSAVSGQRYRGRIELRSFSAESDTFFRLLYDTTTMFAAFFADMREPPKDKENYELTIIWNEFITEVDEIFEKHDFTDLDYSEDKIQGSVDHFFKGREDMKKLIRKTSVKIRRVVKAKAESKEESKTLVA